MAEVNVAAEMCDERASCAVAAVDLDGRPQTLRAAESGGACEEPKLGTPKFVAECRELDHRSFGYRFLKRLFDVVFSFVALIVGLVPGLLFSVAIAVETRSFPIYSQVRIGKWGKPFRIYKIRTMVADSDNVEKYFTPEQLEVWKRERKVDDDPRITRLGRILRATSFDETVQFINVLFGQMTIVGPRAITYEEVGEFGSDATLLLSVPQGITGAWQAGPRNEATFESGERQRIELEYARNACLKEDIRIFLATFSAMLGKRKSGR